MTYKNVTNIVLFSTIAVFALVSFGIFDVFAENEYRMVGDTKPVLTFTFRDGVEVLEFPVFNMGENFVSNSGVSFIVEGSVTNSPLLHEALDEAYKYRFSNDGLDYQFKYFDVDVDFVKNDESINTMNYSNCRIDNYRVETLDSNDYESYFKEVGFAVVDIITFVCSGVAQNEEGWKTPAANTFTDFGKSEFTFAKDVRSSITFEYDDGSEKISFPVFDIDSLYEESSDNVDVDFSVEGLLEVYPLLYRAIDNARQVSGNSYASNTDFDATVEFTAGDDILREIEFRECIVNNSKIITQSDKEEGFIGKSAFAIVQQIGFSCGGFFPLTEDADNTWNIPSRNSETLSNVYMESLENTDRELDIITTFTFVHGTETIEFSMFKQNDVMTATEKVNDDNGNSSVAADIFTRKTTYPTLELRGILGDYPMLYNYVDKNREIQSVAGTQYRDLVDIDVDIVSDGEVLRGFNYVNCRATNYDIDTNTNKDESYAKDKFALENIFDFECQGYHPNNPTYDTMFEVAQADTQSTNDLRNTDQWARGFFVE